MTGYPTYYPGGSPEPHREPLESVSTIGTAAVVLAGGLTATFVFQGVGALLVMDDYAEAAREGQAAVDVLTWVDALFLLQIPLILATYAVTCTWLSRVRANALLLSPQFPHRRGRVWVWLGWWVPVVNLWFPFQVVRDVRESTSPARPPRALVGPWWAAYLAFAVLDRVAAGMTSSSSPLTQESADHLLYAQLASAAVALVAGVLWIGLVREITDNQTKESSAIGNLPQPPAAF